MNELYPSAIYDDYSWIMLSLHIVYLVGLATVLVSLVLGTAFLWSFHISGICYGLYKFHRRKLPNNLKELPGISIIKPLTCIDPNLYENLTTFFNLKYPRYEILFCLQEHNNDLIDLIEELRLQYPHVQSQLFVGSRLLNGRKEIEMNEDDEEENSLVTNTMNNISIRRKRIPKWKRILCCGSQKFLSGDESLNSIPIEIKNPKIFNMLAAYENAQYPFFLISDSGLMMHEDTLYDMALCMTDKIGLVHQMPFTSDRKGFAGSVEKVYFGTQHARMYMTINLLGIICVTGMSCLVRKECIDRVGGLKAFGHYIAEDYYIASEIVKQGFGVRVAPNPAEQNSGDYSISIWMERMIRWYKLRMRISPVAYFEPLQECFSSAILIGVTTNYLFEWNTIVICACHILIWFIFDYLMLRITQGGPLPFSKFEFAVAWFIRELASFYIYFKAVTSSSTIKWRGKEYRLGTGTRAEEIFLSSSSSSSSIPSIIVESSASSSNSTLPVTGSHLLSPSSISK